MSASTPPPRDTSCSNNAFDNMLEQFVALRPRQFATHCVFLSARLDPFTLTRALAQWIVRRLAARDHHRPKDASGGMDIVRRCARSAWRRATGRLSCSASPPARWC
jgi:hypothetical protein